jgi:hypothetical protein
MPSGSDNRWGCWHSKSVGWYDNWQHIPWFVQQVQTNGWMPKKLAKMLSVLDSAAKKQRLGLELHLAVVLGKPLYAITYNLERHGLVAAFAFSYYLTVHQHMTALAAPDLQSPFYVGLLNWGQAHRYGQISSQHTVQAVSDVWAARLAHVSAWREAFNRGMKHWIELYQGFMLLHPATALTR